MTKEQLQQLADIGYSDSEIEKEIEANKKQYLIKPLKPSLAQKHTSEDALLYSEKLKEHEVLKREYSDSVLNISKHNSNLDFLFKEYLEEKSGFTSLSDKEQGLVMEMHYEFGSKNSLIETYQEIESFVDFVNAIKQLNNENSKRI